MKWVWLVLIVSPARAQDAEPEENMTIVGRREQLSRLSGSAHAIGEEALEIFESDDIHKILSAVPGVYTRDEEGFGLRPNIGLRGASSDRSAKITLMEDGVLLAPAPYAAPAAYFFPQATRMTRVEVFKGPASIQYGPNTVGGAINLTTRTVPMTHQGGVDLSLGRFNSQKTHGWVGGPVGPVQIMIEGLRLSSAGFKELDGGGDTGFLKNEIMAKAAWNHASKGGYHRLQLKLGYADEVSNASYLGLSGDDLKQTPYRRYAGSRRDRMEWIRTQVQLDYDLSLDSVDIVITAYRHDFHRAWRKINRFRRADLREVVAHPDDAQLAVFLAILRGDLDSESRGQTILLGTNDRTYVSQGVQASASWATQIGWIESRLELGARIHSDSIERTHTEDGFLMRSGRLIADELPTEITTRNRGSGTALAVHLLDELQLGDDLYLTPGGRMELIRTALKNRLVGKAQTQDDVVFLGGFGAYYQATPWLGVLAGVHQGFSPVAPGQPGSIEAERSINYEAGVRLASGKQLRVEFIGFWNAYSNLSAHCTFSSGCAADQIDEQFNGGAVDVYGLEVLAQHQQPIGGGVSLKGELAYTLSRSAFQNVFSSTNPQFGDVEEGDSLAYVPEHQGRLGLGVTHERFGVNFGVTYTAEMRDVAGAGPIDAAERIPDRWVLDAALFYKPSGFSRIYLTVTNMLDDASAVSLRPFGARPAMPRNVTLGGKYTFGG